MDLGGTNRECTGVAADGTLVWLWAGGEYPRYAQGIAQGICGRTPLFVGDIEGNVLDFPPDARRKVYCNATCTTVSLEMGTLGGGQIHIHPIWVLGARRGGGGGSPKGLVHNLLMQLFTLESSKIKVSETYFFDTVIT